MSQTPPAADLVIKPSDHLVVLEKGLAVIECFDGVLGDATFDRRVFRLAPRVLGLGFAYLSTADLPQILQPALEQLSRTLGESCSASVLDGTDVFSIARVATVRIIRRLARRLASARLLQCHGPGPPRCPSRAGGQGTSEAEHAGQANGADAGRRDCFVGCGKSGTQASRGTPSASDARPRAIADACPRLEIRYVRPQRKEQP